MTRRAVVRGREQHHEHLRTELADAHRRHAALENEIAWLRRRNTTLVDRLSASMRARVAEALRIEELAAEVARLEAQQWRETA